GEYTALVAAGALDLDAAADLVTLRGKSMAMAKDGTMAAVLGLDVQVLERLCAELDGNVVVANFNTPDQLVVSGEPEGIAALFQTAKAAGAKRVVPLNVSGAFHSPLMAPALGPLSEALRRAPWQDAAIPVVHNVDGCPNASCQVFADRLGRQLESSVRWVDCVQTMGAAGIQTFVELGAGKTLCGLIRKIDRDARVLAVEDKASLEAALAEWSRHAADEPTTEPSTEETLAR
ncbi:MAG: ACP S-malonyltransferase, partial [Cyanobacteria bacterium REEB65]|nr:ACP S-malonyltransferase [Cyanobacteria bacterium REEB65]